MRTPHLDVRALPSYAFSHRALTWWGNLGVMAIEGTVFVLTVVSYFYLRSHSATWPMSVLPQKIVTSPERSSFSCTPECGMPFQ